MVTHFKVRHLLEGRRLLEGGTYFNLSTQKGSAYYRTALILKPGAYIENYNSVLPYGLLP